MRSNTTLDLRNIETKKRRIVKLNNLTKILRRHWAKLIGVLIVLTLIGIAAYFVWRHFATAPALKSADLKARIGSHYLLPTDEEPAEATITDVSKLTSPFFKKSQNGDKVLIYQNNKIVIIYRPSLDRIVAVGPVAIDTPKIPK